VVLPLNELYLFRFGIREELDLQKKAKRICIYLCFLCVTNLRFTPVGARFERGSCRRPMPKLAFKTETIASFVAADPFRSLAVYNSCMGRRIQRVYTLAVFPPSGTMWKRAISLIVVLSSLAAASASAQSVVPDSTPAISPAKLGLFDRVISRQKQNEAALDVYERMERLEVRKNGSDAAPASVRVTRVIPSGTGMDRIPLGPDGLPADAAAYRADLAKLEKALALLVNNNRSQRDAVEKFAKRKKERNDLIDATRSAFLFTFVARELRSDRMLSKYRMEPNPAFKPTTRFTAIYTKVHGFAWVDEQAEELARIEGEVTEDISVGLFLGKIYKGSHFMQERYEVAPGLWLASFSQYDFDGRKLFSGFSVHERTFYTNYRYIGPPNEALLAVRKELGLADLGKHASAAGDR
jgi:hypothetical protein